MSQNGLTLGPDAKITVRDSDGVYMYNDIIQSFEYRANTEQRDVNTLGRVVPLSFPKNWTGSFSIIRTDPKLEQYFVLKAERYSIGVNIPDVFIQVLVTEPDGSVSTYNFNKVVMDLEDGGRYERDADVVMRVMFRCQTLKIERG